MDDSTHDAMLYGVGISKGGKRIDPRDIYKDELPPLPDPEPMGWDYDKGWDGVESYGYTADQMREYAMAAVKAEREACAKVAKDLGYTEANMNNSWRNGCFDASTAIQDR